VVSRAKRTAEDWRRAVFRHPAKASIRLGLLYLADFMDSNRKVSRPRKLMAFDLGVSERSVTEMVRGAHDAGLLSTVTPGRKGTTAVYQGLFPSANSGNPGVPAMRAVQGEGTQRAENYEFLPPMGPFSGNPGVPTSSTQSAPLACPYHHVDGLPCPTDCRHYSATSSNEEEAS
jgi:hypothetical protein